MPPDQSKEAERLWARWHAIRMGSHSLAGKLREDKDVLARLVREEVDRAVAEESRRWCAALLPEDPRVVRDVTTRSIALRSSPAKSGEEEKRA